MSDLLWNLGYVIAGIAFLLLGGDFLVSGADRFARKLGISAMVVALTVVAIGTSLPELIVSVYAALIGKPDITVGNAVGSNLFNLLPALGLVAMLIPITVRAAFIRREFPIMMAVLVLTWLSLVLSWRFCLDEKLPRFLAAILLCLLAIYLYGVVQFAKREKDRPIDVEKDEGPPEGTLFRHLLFIAIGFGIMVGGSHLFVDGSVWIAKEKFGVSELVCGLTLIAAGTSFPELFSSLVAVYRNKPDIAVGNIIGSCVFNMLGILGVAGVLNELVIPMETVWRDMPLMILAGLLVWFFIWTGSRISRFKGFLLTALYCGFLYLLISKG